MGGKQSVDGGKGEKVDAGAAQDTPTPEAAASAAVAAGVWRTKAKADTAEVAATEEATNLESLKADATAEEAAPPACQEAPVATEVPTPAEAEVEKESSAVEAQAPSANASLGAESPSTEMPPSAAESAQAPTSAAAVSEATPAVPVDQVEAAPAAMPEAGTNSSAPDPAVAAVIEAAPAVDEEATPPIAEQQMPAAAVAADDVSLSAPAGSAAAATEEEVEAPATQEAKDAKEAKSRTLEQMMSLKPGDDERTEVSKKLSWILRHGAKKVNIEIDNEGWVKMSDLLASDILASISEERLMHVINDSNEQKQRYEFKDDGEGERCVRAISKSMRAAQGRDSRRERRRDVEGERPERPERPDRPDRGERFERADRPDRGDKDRVDGAAPQRRGKGEGRGGWWEPGWKNEAREGGAGASSGGPGANDEGPTFEQQMREGFRPVYEGDKVVAMVRENQTVRPGRRVEPPSESRSRGEGRGSYRSGRGKGERDRERDRDRIDGDVESKGEGWSKGDRYPRRADGAQPRQIRWRVVHGQDAIVRAGEPVDSDHVGTLLSGTLVAQIGEDKVLWNGIIRMMVEAIEPQAGMTGWVTRSAESAGGPVFFKPDRSSRDRNAEDRGDRERGGERGRGRGKGQGRGKGRRPQAGEGGEGV